MREFFHRDGRSVPRHEAEDENGILRDGYGTRVHMEMRDSSRGSLRVTDAAGRGGVYLSRPGFRCLLEDDAGAHAKAEARRCYENSLVNAWRDPIGLRDSATDTDAHGGIRAGEKFEDPDDEENGEEDDKSRRRLDARSVQQVMRDHQVRMSSIYERFDRELSETWRRS
jgi:hypothetical protein